MAAGDLGADVAEGLEVVIASLLELQDEPRAAEIARIAERDPRLASRVKSRLAALDDLGLALDAPRRGVQLPQRFGSMRRIERVAGGGMGEVHLARDERTNALAALKLVRPDHLWFEAARARFRREIEATTRLSHPGIVRVLDVGEESGIPWLAMEWVGGATLEEVLERVRGVPPESLSARDFAAAVRASAALRPQPEPEKDDAFAGAGWIEVVTRVVALVAEALAHAHELGVLHRDVKPSNVLVTPAGRVLLVDFGLALPRGVDRMTRTGAWLGSLPYAAPEQLEGGATVLDARADVYSLGATLYELLTLKTPFLGGPESVVRRRIATGDLEAPRKLNHAVGTELERACLAALDPDPRRRPASTTLFAADLELALAGKRVRARGAPAWLRARRWMRRYPERAAATAIALLIVLGSLAFAVRESTLAARFTRLADAELVRGLDAEARAFWPAARGGAAPMTAWLARAEELLARRAEHARAYEELTLRARPLSDEDRALDQAEARGELAGLAREVDGLAAFVAHVDRSPGGVVEPLAPPTPEEIRARDAETRALLDAHAEALLDALRARVDALDATLKQNPARWKRDLGQIDDFRRVLDRASSALRERRTFRFDDPLDAWRHEALRRLLADLERLGAITPRVRAQRGVVESVERLELEGGAAAWASARAAIARSPRYGGLDVRPVFGLLPLGEDPRTGLWEFCLTTSGKAPARDHASPSGWRLDAQTGMVLVLLPGARFEMGQREGEGAPLPSSLPAHEVELAPCFISKFELTDAQAERLGAPATELARQGDGRLPLAMDWDRARTLLLEAGLELPTEAQWEYAARGGVAGAFPSDAPANVNDRSRTAALIKAGSPNLEEAGDLDDGWPDAAPVGSFPPNGFGLHDMLGNVAEWCLDHHVSRAYATLTPRTGDGLRTTVASAQLRALRGGSFVSAPRYCQPAPRRSELPSRLAYWIGVRPARSLSLD